MLNGKRIAVVMPAYNAAATLRQTYDDILKRRRHPNSFSIRRCDKMISD